jgi:preprotein translocase subunit YajC
VELLPFLLLFLVFWLLIIRPNRRRQQRTLLMQRSLEPGQPVITTSGLYGTIFSLDDDGVVLEVAPGVHTRWLRAAIAEVIVNDTPDIKE